jgi:ATP-dependent DNA helicase RecQ
VLELLKSHFGFDAFLPLQEEIIASVMGGQDTFALMPTGGGKSLCYQLPALALGGLALVVSPLIALMKDQVDGLKANGINAAFINSSLPAQEISRVQQQVRNGGIKMLYVAPERVTLPGFQRFLEGLDVSLIAIDEAHCISEWGHDFRPAYRELKTLRNSFAHVPAIALTATATERVRADILSQLGLRRPNVFISSFNRPNLTYAVEPKKEPLAALLRLLEKHRGESAIVYCTSRRATEETAQALSERGHNAEPYHAGLEPQVRATTQERFIRDQIPIVVATIAFGMGIDKPDIRLVVHYDLPKSLEGYYQETGRAGRDGMPSECVLYYSYGDKTKQEFFINQIDDPEEQDRARQKLNQVLELCTRQTCRRQFLIEYLGEEWPEENCGGCDVCLLPREEYDATEITQKVLSAVVRTGERFGAGHVISVLLGAGTKRVVSQRHDELSVFGVASQHSSDELKELFVALGSKGLLETASGQYPTLRLSPKGKAFLNARESLTLSRAIHRNGAAEGPDAPEQSYDVKLFTQLSALRKQLADQRRVPAYVIFGNKTLQDMARRAPQTVEEFARISGVGEAKLRDLSEPFLELVASYVETNGLPEFDASASKNPRSRKPATGIISQTIRETGLVVSAGASLSEAASKRSLSEETILTHLERLVQSGVGVEIDHLMPPPERRQKIEEAFESSGETLLRPVREMLSEEYSYLELRAVRVGIHLKRVGVGQSERWWGSRPQG